jgi:hypothetical protein
VPLKLTVELFVKPTPVIVTTFPTAPLVGVKLTTDSVGLNRVLLVAVPAGVVTEMSADGAPLGTVASTCVAESAVKVAFAEPKWTAVALLRPVPVIVTVLPVMPDVGVNDVIVGRSEITAAVASERAGAPPPTLLLAVSCTRIVEPTYPEVVGILKVALVAPEIAEQLEEDAGHSAQCSVYVVGLLLHVPWVTVSVWPCSAVPLIVGSAVFAGAVGEKKAPRPTGLPTPVGPSYPERALHAVAPEHEPLLPEVTSYRSLESPMFA